MQKLFFALLLTVLALPFAQAQDVAKPQYKVVTIVESIVPMGVGRSRMIESQEQVATEDFTTERTDGRSSDQGAVRRKDLKAKKFSETKLLNFYSAVGINFQNIASNDALISAKMNEMAEAGWELMFVTSGVESHAGTDDSQGIFITRTVFKKMP